MKKLLLLFMLLISLSSTASHYMGGEITWQCLPNGRFRFIMKLYRECNGMTYGTAETIQVTNCPFLTSLTMTLYPGGNPHDPDDGILDGKTDLSPDCYLGSVIQCNPSPSTPNTGAVEEWYYTSDSGYPTGVLLAGVPPAAGWIFSHSSCCRNPCTNITGTSSMSWFLRSIMYPLNGMNAYPCYDNAPRFAEPPATVICSGYPATLISHAYELDLDSLSFEWDCPGSFLPSQYAPGFACDTPLPGAVLDTVNGDIYINPTLNGSFLYVLRITSYRCGIKISEVFRELQMIILSGCAANNPPVMNAPFYNPYTQLFDTWKDTISVGDSVSTTITAQDLDLLPNGNPNTLYLEASGPYFGAGFTNPSAGCIDPPCATLDPPPPMSAMVALATQFNWAPDCDQIEQWLATSCYHHFVPPYYYFPVDFIFKVHDNACPVPGYTNNRMTIVVRAGTAPSFLQCVHTDSSGNVTLTWLPPPDTAHYFVGYIIYRSPDLAGPFDSIATIYNSAQNTYIDVGINPNWDDYYYCVRTISGCIGDTLSNIRSTCDLSLSFQYGNPSLLNWITADSLSPYGAWYYVYMRCGAQQWTLLDSTQSIYYSLTGADSVYNGCQFRVLMSDTAGCSTYSSALTDPYGIDETDHTGPACIEVSPNPALDVLYVRCRPSALKGGLDLFDMYGRKYPVVIPRFNAGAEMLIDVSSLPQGIYYLRNSRCVEITRVLILR